MLRLACVPTRVPYLMVKASGRLSRSILYKVADIVGSDADKVGCESLQAAPMP